MSDRVPGRRFAISDVHGCATTFAYLLHEKLKIAPGDRLYLLGDLVNRGPDSKGVFKEVRQLQKNGVEVILFRGNHDEVLLQAYESGKTRLLLSYGGDPTLASFGVKKVKDIPEKYIDMIRESYYYLLEDPFIFVHAGLNFSRPNVFDDKEAMLWIKKMTIDKEKLGNRILVHGHTPWSKAAIREQFATTRRPQMINIDGGCVYNHPGSRLVALNLDTMELTFAKNRED